MLSVKNNDYDFFGKPYTKSIDAINRIEKIVSKTENEISDLQYQLDVLKEERLRVCKSEINYPLFDWLMGPAQKWLNALSTGLLNGEKVDKRKKYDEKSSYEMLKDRINTYLGVDVEITSITTYGLSKEGYIIYFSYNDKKYNLYVPIVKNVTMKSIDNSGVKYCFSLNVAVETGPCSWKVLFYTYEEEELKDLFKEHVDGNNNE